MYLQTTLDPLSLVRFPINRFWCTFLLLSSITLSGCGSQITTARQKNSPTPLLPVISSPVAKGAQVSLNVVGNSLLTPLYIEWFKAFKTAYPNIQIRYQLTNQETTIREFATQSADFATMDVPLESKEIQEIGDRGFLMIPVGVSGIALVYNVPGIESGLKLPREVYSGMLMGQITKWNHPAIVNANPSLSLPNLPIRIIYQSSIHGATPILTRHLSAMNKTWKALYGEGRQVVWPTGVGVDGNDGAVNLVQSTPGSLTYLDYQFAEKNKLAIASLQNDSGQFVSPTAAGITAALTSISVPDTLLPFLPDPSGSDAYPIVGYTWFLFPQHHQPKIEPKVEALKSLLIWSLTEGQIVGQTEGYAPIPTDALRKIQPIVKGL